jgi:hypothetical protein
MNFRQFFFFFFFTKFNQRQYNMNLFPSKRFGISQLYVLGSGTKPENFIGRS